MLHLRKKLLVGALCSAMALTAVQSAAWSETADNAGTVQSRPIEESAESSSPTGESAPTAEAENEPSAESAPSEEPEEEEEEVVLLTDSDALKDCELMAENNNLALYVNKSTGLFGVQVKENGYIWWSNPINADNDPMANNSKKDDLKSALVLNAVKVSDTEAPSTTVRSYKDCVKNGGLVIEPADGGFKASYTFNNEGITIPFYVKLMEDHFEVSIAVNEIYEEEHSGTIKESSRSIVDVNLLQDLGAAFSDEEGYIVTPDGSGAVINFNNGKTSSAEYNQRIYGKDLAISQDTAPKKTEKAYLPIMGIVKNGNAMLEVVTEGQAYASGRAAVAGQKATSYNSAWFNFTLRSTDVYYMGGTNSSALNAYELNLIPEERVTVSYYPIAKDDVSYVDIALRYQQYLVENEGLTKKATSEDAPFYLDVFGGTVKQRSVMGFPVNLETAATTYEQAKSIIQSFRDLGIDNMIVSYEDFNKAGITGRISNSVDYSGTLGGKSKFNALKQYCDEIGAKLAPSVDLMNYEKSGNGYSKTGASSIGVTKAYATQGVYELAFGTPHDTRTSWYVLTPAYYEKVYGEVISSFTKEGIGAINVAGGTNMLYSDFTGNASRQTSRQKALENLKKCYQKINDSGMTFVSSAANSYALPYVDFLKDVPLYSSNFDVYDYDIPLYEIVIHGYIPYTTKAKNASSGADELFVYSVATGTPLHYEVMYEDPNEFTDCSYDELFYTHYEGWLQSAANEYKVVQDYVKPLTDETITDFKYLSADTVQTTFSDGTVIEADLAELTIKVNGAEVNLAGYGVEGVTTE